MKTILLENVSDLALRFSYTCDYICNCMVFKLNTKSQMLRRWFLSVLAYGNGRDQSIVKGFHFQSVLVYGRNTFQFYIVYIYKHRSTINNILKTTLTSIIKRWPSPTTHMLAQLPQPCSREEQIYARLRNVYAKCSVSIGKCPLILVLDYFCQQRTQIDSEIQHRQITTSPYLLQSQDHSSFRCH